MKFVWEASAKDPGSAARNSTTPAAPGRHQEAAEFPTKHCSYHTWPDMVLVSGLTKQVLVLELTVHWEDRIEEVQERRWTKYADLVAECWRSGWMWGLRVQGLLRIIMIMLEDAADEPGSSLKMCSGWTSRWIIEPTLVLCTLHNTSEVLCPLVTDRPEVRQTEAFWLWLCPSGPVFL